MTAENYDELIETDEGTQPWEHNNTTRNGQLGSVMGPVNKKHQASKVWDDRIRAIHEGTRSDIYQKIEGLAVDIGLDTSRNTKTGQQHPIIENAKGSYNKLDAKGKTRGRVSDVVAATCLYIGALQAGSKFGLDDIIPSEYIKSVRKLYPKVVSELSLDLPERIPKPVKNPICRAESRVPKPSGGRRMGIFTETEVKHLRNEGKINEKSQSKIHTHLNKVIPAVQQDLWLLNSSKHLAPWRAKNRRVLENLSQQFDRLQTITFDQESFELPVKSRYNPETRKRVYWLDETKPLQHPIQRMFDPSYGLGKINDPSEKARIIEMRKAHAIPIGRLNAISLDAMEYNVRKAQRPIEDVDKIVKGNPEFIKIKIRILEEELKCWNERLKVIEEG